MRRILVLLSIVTLSFSAFAEDPEGQVANEGSGYNADLCKLLEAALPVSLKLQQSAEFRFETDKGRLERKAKMMSDYVVLGLNGNSHTRLYGYR
jgi:hypothetical protein